MIYNDKTTPFEADKPMVSESGDTRWYNSTGHLHRANGPAKIYQDGSTEWCRNGWYHRIGGPAIEWVDGTKEWWIDGQRHRLGGPAVVLPDGTEEWWIYGRQLDKFEYWILINK